MNKRNKILIVASSFVLSMALCYIGQTNSDYYDVISSNIDAIVRTTGGDDISYNGVMYQPVYLDQQNSEGESGGCSEHYDFDDGEWVVVNGKKEWKCYNNVYTSPKKDPPICYRLIFRL